MQLLKLENKLLPHTLKCSMLSRAILTGEITTHKFTKILFRYSQFLQTIKCAMKSTEKACLI